MPKASIRLKEKNMKAKAFDTRLFKRILKFTKPINGVLMV
jgi:hypothetical protein